EDIIKKTPEQGLHSLSEYDSKQIIASAGVQISRETLAADLDECIRFAEGETGYPVVLKGASASLAHKTEQDMVKLDIKDRAGLEKAYAEITEAGIELDGVLVQEMVKGKREFVIGLTRDPQFGPVVMFGIGGIFTEVFEDVSFRIAPLSGQNAEEMVTEIKAKKLLGSFRGMPPVDIESLKKALIGIGELALKYDKIEEIDINPLIISGSTPVAVDALVILNK
ncbi:MAG: acetate--CoA ligase family protein, partial [bacterium]